MLVLVEYWLQSWKQAPKYWTGWFLRTVPWWQFNSPMGCDYTQLENARSVMDYVSDTCNGF